jgi:hypothetical protein
VLVGGDDPADRQVEVLEIVGGAHRPQG